jgi:hypothetical protein
MPTIFEEGHIRFFLNTHEKTYEPPHIHVWIGKEDVCRLNLIDGSFMENPPPGEYSNIMTAYRKHAASIRRKWDEIHGR